MEPGSSPTSAISALNASFSAPPERTARIADSSRPSASGDKASAARPSSKKSCIQPSRSEEHTSELQSLMRISYAVFCLKKQKTTNTHQKKNSKQVKNKKQKS